MERFCCSTKESPITCQSLLIIVILSSLSSESVIDKESAISSKFMSFSSICGINVSIVFACIYRDSICWILELLKIKEEKIVTTIKVIKIKNVRDNKKILENLKVGIILAIN